MSDEFNNWSQIADALAEASDQMVRKSAFDIQGGYQARAKVVTGFMKNSAYVVTSADSNYGSVQQPQKDQVLLPEVEKPDDNHTAIVAIGAEYALPMEFGTIHMPAHPALVPAVEAVRPSFEAAMGKIEDKLKEVRGG